MKQLIYGIVSFSLVILVLVTVLTVEGHTARENQMSDSVALSVKETLSVLNESRSSAPKSNEELEQKLKDVLAVRLNEEKRSDTDTNYSLEISVDTSDVDKEILSCHVIETYSSLTGSVSSVERYATAVIEKEDHHEMHEIVFLIHYENGAEEVVKKYYLESGEKFPKVPDIASEIVPDKEFTGWYENENAVEEFPTDIQADARYVAKFR